MGVMNRSGGVESGVTWYPASPDSFEALGQVRSDANQCFHKVSDVHRQVPIFVLRKVEVLLQAESVAFREGEDQVGDFIEIPFEPFHLVRIQ